MEVFRRETIEPITRSKSKKATSVQSIMSSSDQSNPVSCEEFDGLSKQITDLAVLLKKLHQSTHGPKMLTHTESSTQGGTKGSDKTNPELQLITTDKNPENTHLKGDLDTGDIRKKVLQMEETLHFI